MSFPLRILRAEANALWPPPPLPPAQAEREAEILRVAEAMLVRHLRGEVTFRAVADLAGLAITTLRRYFADIESIIGAILTRHLRGLIAALQAIPAGPNQASQRRAAYLAAARGPHAGYAAAHNLLQSRRELPADVRAPLEALRHELGTLLAGAHGSTALLLLDDPNLPLTQIEAMLAAIAASPAAAPATPAPAAPAPGTPAPPPAPKTAAGAVASGPAIAAKDDPLSPAAFAALVARVGALRKELHTLAPPPTPTG